MQDQPWGRGRCHPFCRSRSHLEEADDTGTPPAVTEAGFERMTLVLREMCLTHLTTTAQNRSWSHLNPVPYAVPGAFVTHRLSRPRKKFELIMKQGTIRDEPKSTDELCDQSYLRDKKSSAQVKKNNYNKITYTIKGIHQTHFQKY